MAAGCLGFWAGAVNNSSGVLPRLRLASDFPALYFSETVEPGQYLGAAACEDEN